MAEENVDNIAIVQSLVEVFARPDLLELFDRVAAGDASALAEMAPFVKRVDPEIEWDTSGLATPDAEIVRGPQDLFRFWMGWFAEWDRYSAAGSGYEAIGDHVVYDVVIDARSRSGEVPVQWRHTQVVTMRNQRVVRWRAFGDRAKALEAIGQVE